ncbi:glycosyltransferase family 4 protein [Paraburkholderia sp. CNPSo 3076]|uniref:glycosyltransferase family 4 protein n=1 Tax=Paraburkholderia sp. CNPSo 3076 TaxID=2940936 RepID=UPI0022593D25|nr:glycosyltransferase family 4 protein [Paraburkholderia sp. CNPSo 3076]MCX5539971.1 glycosyltransferase family 4 protein [Paraburkholderia sp. CNPSo 3076]
MKVLFNTYPMAFHTPGGGEVQLMQYYRHLPEHGVDVKLLDMWNPQFKEHDFMHFFSCMSGSLHFCSFMKRIGMPLVVSPNLWITEETKGNYPYDEIRLIFVLADRVVCNSNAECDLLASVFNIEREKFATVYNGIDNHFLVRLSPDVFRSRFNIDEPFVLNVANIEPRKNQLNLIRALKQHPELKLVLIGHVRDTDYASQCFAEGGDQLKYLGPLPHDSDELRSAYAACSVFALPSALETPGLAALEAFACGASVVVTEEGCTREYFGEGALYVAHDDVDGISQAIAQSVSRSSARAFLSSIVAGANFTWHTCVGELLRVYRELQGDSAETNVKGGFRTIERDNGGSLFAWTREFAQFDCEAGIIRGLWRSEAGATVDISIGDEVADQQVEISENWAPFQIVVPKAEGTDLNRVTISNIRQPDGSLVQERGVALRDLSFDEARGANFDQAVVLSNLLRKSSGFFWIESDPSRYFAWTGTQCHFRMKRGQLVFGWRSEFGATVDIDLNGVPWKAGVPVGTDWSEFMLDVGASAAGDDVAISLRVSLPEEAKSTSGRLLGVAIGACRFNAYKPLEQDDDPLFAWTSGIAQFDCQAGIIQGVWRSEAGATADISIDEAVAYRQVEISEDWTPFQIVVPKTEGAELKRVMISNIRRQDGSVAEERILAMRTVSFAEARPTYFDQAIVLSNLQRSSHGFFSIESDPYRYFAWTGTQCHFRMKPGQLVFGWHSVCGATVDIDVNKKTWKTGVPVGTDWSEFMLDAEASAAGDDVEISLRVSLPEEAKPIGGRLLGVAIGACRFNAHQTGADYQEKREDAHSN